MSDEEPSDTYEEYDSAEEGAAMFAGFGESDDESGDGAANPLNSAMGLVQTFEAAEALEEELEDQEAMLVSRSRKGSKSGKSLQKQSRRRRAAAVSSGEEEEEEEEEEEGGRNEGGDKDAEQSDTDDVQALSHNMSDELDKAKAVQVQHSVLDGLFSVRMRQQRALNLANRLPQHDTMPLFRAGSKQAASALDGVCSSLCGVLDDLLRLQGCLVAQSETTCNYLGVGAAERQLMRSGEAGTATRDTPRRRKRKRPSAAVTGDEQADSGQQSGSEEETVEEASVAVADLWMAPGGVDALWERIEKVQKRCEPYQMDTLERWSRRTQLSSRISQSKFKALNKSIGQQVQDVLRDRERLTSRTTLKRISYRVLGTEKRARTNERQRGSANARVYDPEIFDDLDFYQQLVKRQLTESSDSSDPFSLGQAYIKSREEHYKQRKEVDRKANKMKKVSFDTHDKLVNFLVPDHRLSTPDYVDQLFANLFR
jgi:protein AATF/BFR2